MVGLTEGSEPSLQEETTIPGCIGSKIIITHTVHLIILDTFTAILVEPCGKIDQKLSGRPSFTSPL